jgi:ubiquinone/menaquinone biosynthesis C-methylase UbiE
MSASPGESTQHQLRRRPDARPPVQSANELKFLGFMVSISGVAKNDRVLDVACGSGSTTLAFAERCRGTVGLDAYPDALARATAAAAERGITNAAFILSELERMPVADGAFDGATCRFSFHHIVHPERVFGEMARAVAPGGWIVISDLVTS